MGVQVLYSNAAGNRDAHLANMENAVQMGVDGIITGQTLIEQFADVISRSMAAGISVITLDAGSSPALADVTRNDWIVGIQQGLALVDLLPGQKGKIIEFYNPGYKPCDIRYSAYRSVLQWFPEIQVLAVGRAVYPNTVPEAKARMEAFLQQYPAGEISGVYANYDLEGLGALQAMQEVGRTEFPIVGCDCEAAALESMGSGGPFKADVFFDGYEMGKQAAVAMVKYLREGVTPSRSIYVPSELVTIDNLPWALDALGLTQ
jgi:ABC-type sugar transport system substrate-binding protein